MKEYVLNYYPKFSCSADKCKHTCCAGWKMNIDQESLSKYKSENSSFAQTLNKGINFKKACFRVDKSGRCAFLNDKGLCEIIINLGEQSLCQVCRDHPRFRSFFDDRIELGLGFCCEEATRTILTFQEKIQPVLESDDGIINKLDFAQEKVIEFRQRALEIIQDRNLSINDRVNKLLTICNAKILEKDFSKIIKKFLSLERLDKNWTKRLKKLKKKTLIKQIDEKYSLYCEQFLVNEVYRHLCNAEDTMWVRAITIASVIFWWIIQSILENELVGEDFLDLLADVVRAFSSEVEYSQKNLDKLYAFTYNFVAL